MPACLPENVQGGVNHSCSSALSTAYNLPTSDAANSEQVSHFQAATQNPGKPPTPLPPVSFKIQTHLLQSTTGYWACAADCVARGPQRCLPIFDTRPEMGTQNQAHAKPAALTHFLGAAHAVSPHQRSHRPPRMHSHMLMPCTPRS